VKKCDPVHCTEAGIEGLKHTSRQILKTKNCPTKKSGNYSINCKGCDKIYIGQPKKNLDTCMKEHNGNIKSCQTDKSAVAVYVWDRLGKITQIY
jgi:hypothetical protein